MSINEVEIKVRELRQLQTLIEEAQAEAEAIKDSLKATMGDSEELRAGEYRITWKDVKTARIDTKALQAALPDVAQAFTRETTTRRFCVAWGGAPVLYIVSIAGAYYLAKSFIDLIERIGGK